MKAAAILLRAHDATSSGQGIIGVLGLHRLRNMS